MEEEGKTLSAAEAAEYGEFKRTKRESEILFTLKKLVVDASRREANVATLKKACEAALRLHASGVLVSPVNVSRAKKALSGGAPVCCLVGGTGESLISVKKTETKKAIRQGAHEIRLILCYSALTGGNFSYLKREIKRIRRAAKKRTLTVSLEDRCLGAEEIELGVRAACAAKADGVCVRGEASLVLRAAEASGGRLFTEVSDVENAEQLRFMIKAGAARASTLNAEKIADELYAALRTDDGEE